MVPAQLLGSGDEHLQWCVACTGPHSSQTGVNAITTLTTATMELATPKLRLWWAWIPVFAWGAWFKD